MLSRLKTSLNLRELTSKLEYQIYLRDIQQNLLPLSSSSSFANNFTSVEEEERTNDMLLRSNGVIKQIDEEVHAIYYFLRDIYALKFPELESILPNRLDYVKVVKRIGNEMDLTLVDLTDLLPNNVIMVLAVSSSTTLGKPLTNQQLQDCLIACDEVVLLFEHKQAVLSFVEQKIHRIAPNLSNLIGSQLTAQLIGLTGNVSNLSKIPACNIQVIGQEKNQLIHSVNKNTTIPHAGILFSSSLLNLLDDLDLKRKGLKILASKVALAARVDAYQSSPEGAEGLKLKVDLEDKFQKLNEPNQNFRTKKALPIPEEKKKAHRGGRRIRKLKEKFMLTDVRKQQNRMNMSLEEHEYGDSAMGWDQGNVGVSTSSSLRAPKKTQSQFLKNMKKAVNKSSISSSAVGGMTTSLAFTPVQGIELANPNAAAERVREANQKWFNAQSGFLSAAPKY